ncbi:MAG TPA: Ig-like domain-containing protein [Bacillota bacterium]|nr:Ig-like domain-containing protein [Bacillota bacterium]
MFRKLTMLFAGLVFFLSAAMPALPQPASAAGVQAGSFALYYGYPNAAEIDKLKKFDMVIIEAKYFTADQIKEIQKAGTRVIGYTPGLSMDQASPAYSGLQTQDYLVINGKRVENRIDSNSPDWLLDPRSQHLRQVIAGAVKSQLYDKGLDGVFVGSVTEPTEFLQSFVTLDNTALQKIKPELMQATATLFGEIKAINPAKLVIQNNGWRELKAYTGPYIDGLVWVNYPYELGTTNGWVNDRRRELLDMRAAYGVTLFALNNLSSANYREMDRFYADARSYGIVPYASVNGYGAPVNTYNVPPRTTVDTTPPTVVETIPAQDAVGVPLDTDVTLIFSESMDQSTLSAVTINGPDGAVVPATLIYTDKKLVLNPDRDFTCGTGYTVQVPATVKDANGVAIARQFILSFSTVSVPEKFKPQSYALYFGPPGTAEIEKMKKFDLVVVEPKYYTAEQIKEIRKSGTRVIGYNPSLTIDKTYPHFTNLLPEDYLVVNGKKIDNSLSNDWVLDPRSPHLRQVIVDYTRNQIYGKGLDGVFLDNFNIPSEFLEYLTTLDTATLQKLRQELFSSTASLAGEIAAIDPDKLVVINNGFRELIRYVAPYIDGIMWENYPYELGTTNGWVNNRRRELLDLEKSNGFFVLALKNFTSANYQEIDKYYADARSYGIIPYASIGGYGASINTYKLPPRTN